MATKTEKQPELILTPADITPGQPGDPKSADAELIDDSPDVVKMDLRKFNKAKAKVTLAVSNIRAITVIMDQAGVTRMMSLLKEADGVGKLIEAKRKDLGDPYRLQVDRVNACAKEIVKDLPDAIKAGKDLILAFHKAEEKKAKLLRKQSREKYLTDINMRAFTKEVDGQPVIYHWTNDQEQMIMNYQVEDYAEDQWLSIIAAQAEERRIKEEKVAEKQKEAIDFFGADDTTNVIEPVKATPPAVSYSGSSYSAPSTKGLTKRWIFEVTDITQVPREFLQVDETKIRAAIANGTRALAGVRIYQEESISLR